MQLNDRSIALALITVVAAVLSPPQATAMPLTLDGAIERALTSNVSLAVKRLGVGGGELEVAAAEEAFSVRVRPTAGFTSRGDERYASYGVTAERLLPTGTTVGAAVTRNEGRLATGDPFSVDRVSLELRQPLFRDFGAAATKAALASSEANRRRRIREYDRARADLALQVVREYTGVVRARAQVEAWRESLRRVQLLHRASRAPTAPRRQRRLDALHTEMLRVAAENRLTTGVETLDAAQRSLALSLGMPPGSRFDPAPVAMPAPAGITDADAVATALAHRLDYAQALDDQAMALREARLIARNRYPDLSVFVRFQSFTDPLSAAEVAAFGGGGVAVGLTGGFDTTFTARGIARDQGENRVAAVNAAVAAIVARIEVEVRGSMDAYDRALREAGSAESGVDLARRRAELARRLFNAGRTDAGTVVDAEAALTAAESERLAARSEVVTRAYALAHGMGTLLGDAAGTRP